ncbi:MAG TPA: type II secretion system F family protein [Candidatus Saccharimonadales bacterium]
MDKTTKKTPSKQPRRHLPFKEREYFSENLAMLLKSGVPVGQALDALATSTHNRNMKKILDGVQGDIEAGMSLAQALERSHIMSRQTLALVRLGESSGRLIDNLQLAAQQEEKRHLFRSKLRSALIYPAFVLSLTLVVGLGVAWFLLPRLSDTFSQLGADLPLVSKIMINFGLFLKEYGIIAVPATLAGVLLIGYIAFGFRPTRRIGQWLLFSFPGIGRLIREIEIAQFGYLLGTLLDAGLPITQATNLLENATNATRYQRFYHHLGQSLSDGYSFKESLDHYKKIGKLIDPSVQQMVISGERSGSLSMVLRTIGRTYEQKADTTTNNLETILEPILLIIVWLGVMVVAVAVIIPVYSLVGGLNA